MQTVSFTATQSITTSSYDVIVIKHRNETFKSTPFQVVFSEKALKIRESKKNKSKQLQFLVNEELIDLPLRIDPSNGRIQFQKKYIRKTGVVSDGSDMSDDQKLSNRSASKQKSLGTTGFKGGSIEELKNQQAPTKFWQFAWLFNSKSSPQPAAKILEQNIGDEQSKLARIKEQPYEGEQSSKQPLFQLSLCGQSLSKMKKQASREQAEKMFYANRVQYKQFIKDPLGIINNSNLVVRIDNSLYTWQLGAAVLASKFAFGVEPNQHFADQLVKAKTKKSWYSIFGSSNVTKLDIQQKQPPTLRPPKVQEVQVIKWRKSPDSEMLQKMHLRSGQNKARIVLQLLNGQTEEVDFKIFLWSENEQVVISDIDGTITKSDVIGQLKTNYIHKGVCLLFNEIYKRNYKILYMTARAIGQYGQTRRFLQKQVQQNGMKLPPGPLFMSPQNYLISFRRQVIEKTPDQLKIKLLATVNEIFPNNKKPIIAGFGNRQTDTIAYLRIKIPPDRIFCISEKSIITNEQNKDFSTTYIQMLEKVDDYFTNIKRLESSETSALQQSSKQKQIQENDEQGKKVVRKLSHSQFYQRSPKSTQGREKSPFRSAGKTKSQEGEPLIEDQAFLLWCQEYKAQKKQPQK